MSDSQAPAQQAPPGQTNAELRAQIKQTINDAREAARAAAQEGARPVIVGGPTPPAPPGTIIIPGGRGYGGDFGGNDFPPQVVDISIAFFIMCGVMVIGWPIARAFGKRLERRTEVAAVTPAVTEQLQRIEQAVDAMAVEIERISESQRFIAKLQNEQAPERASLPVDRR